MAVSPKAPTITVPKNNEKILTFSPVISGLAENDTRILIIVDNKIIGSVKIKNGKKKIGNFSFTVKNLKAGKHSIYAVADRGKERSVAPPPIYFIIPQVVIRKLDGAMIPLEKYRSWPVGVMIENLPVVRASQRGLSEAKVVYETLAEGGATRFLAIFDGKNIAADKIMPVRSTRPYYAQWAREYSAPLMHAGGSPDGIWEVLRLHLPNIDFLRGKTSKYFWRTDGTDSVHNVATSNGKISQMLDDFYLNGRIPDFQGWKFKKEDDPANRGKDKTSVLINFGTSAFSVEYRYDKTKNIYERWNGGRPQIDANGKKQLSVKNVIIQYIPKEKVLDRKGRLELKITGEGSGMILQNGKIINVLWEKKNASSRTVFRYQNKKEVEFVNGSTWVEIVPAGKTIIIKK